MASKLNEAFKHAFNIEPSEDVFKRMAQMLHHRTELLVLLELLHKQMHDKGESAMAGLCIIHNMVHEYVMMGSTEQHAIKAAAEERLKAAYELMRQHGFTEEQIEKVSGNVWGTTATDTVH